MKKIFLLTVLAMAISCKKDIPEETREQINKNKKFWINRNNMIKKDQTNKEYPIKGNQVITKKIMNSIDIHSQSLQFEVYIDDVLLYNFKGEATKNQGGAIGSHDINPLLLSSGLHEVKVRLYPSYGDLVFGDGGGINLVFFQYPYPNLKQVTYNENMNGEEGIFLDQQKEFWMAEKGEYGKPSYVAAHYESKEPLKLKGLPMYEWRSTFEASVPFDYVGWRNSVNLKKENEESDALKKELYSKYNNIYEIIKNKEIDKFISLIKEREELTGKTLFYGANEMKLRENEFIKLLKNDDYEIEPLFEESFYLDFQGYGKLVTIVNKADKDGIIRLKNKKNTNEVIYLDFLFQRKIKGNPLSII